MQALAIGLLLALGATGAQAASQVTRVEVLTVIPSGIYKDVAYVRVSGTVHGVVAPDEDVVGLDALPKNTNGEVEYASRFEAIVPRAGQSANEALYVDAENRGTAVSQGALGGFLQAKATSYARVQWQTAISPGVPAEAQGIGLVILRDFARWMAGRTPAEVVGGWSPPAHRRLILGGISQSAWLVNTFIAEGFNVDPKTKRRVFDGAIAIDGVGGWLAINRIAADRGVKGQHPYLDPDGVPLQRAELLKRPKTDPVYVDVANATDFYRLRAGLTSTAHTSDTFRRYDFPSPHAIGAANPRCNDGQPITYHSLRYAPYMRALVLGIEKAIGVKAAAKARPLPPSAVFELGPAPSDVAWFNPLPGVEVTTPVLDANGWPKGGVRFPESEQPLGRPLPPAVSPVTTASISQTCGNAAGWQAFAAAERQARGLVDEDSYLTRYQAALRRLEAEGFLLSEDLPKMAADARTAAP
ncbi:alpha/beta hydrolase domain-containing protein [uncultured Phenylobacterium sp.]|uniref:alpha/beta hydrolase domain-containing protein n=1 Tax=uncultured Phenylobacterium sp. TaxID=349273 RepID=UPI0025DA7037|nr:alpha/beta hydrolase domain-containing protein [uncultured Phenylobacterium sp.]